MRRSEEKLRSAREALGAGAVHRVRINSARGEPSALLGYEASAWRPGALPGCLPNGGAGEPPSRPPMPDAVREFWLAPVMASGGLDRQGRVQRTPF